ncbi:hypothetical protein [uncultured Mediterranean phage uvMED]|nr:hypothetical protein [uncultured Mediterranean phage uvMED]BAR19040.1 hypothetical protein [uncultured Mediterranean phage uvMED]
MTTYIDKNIIAKAITNIAKKKNFNYSNAIEKRKKNYKAYKESKTNRELQKKLSKDRFNTYLEEKYKNDN